MDEYILYKGETYLHTGTIAELAEFRGISWKSMYYYTTPSYQKVVDGRKNARNYITVTKLID